MEKQNKPKITIQTNVNSTIEKVWKCWTNPEDIKKWNAASDDWHTVKAENDLQTGGKFSSRMEAKDGSFGFDFWGVYDKVESHRLIEYTLGDNRKVSISFSSEGKQTKIVETFEAENENSLELQKNGWQAILNNFKKYVETKS